ncbi:hypothetical protein AGABI2DRAFT_116765 [Agaricus bisporus var. bisporus H97]|uniref:hypothetical protein n=1 Tax=Agaricus bisporus var. bisporus (strain H97 / ATCC MYA-4626 / FGSC 10389) TaxID=936046 RepID=UPI00029F6562|nr:hypothetical protein AGABI2DRAFT_116765 [Agaricus bisporus var. bisporus H97]EKV47960.1 hypothetical protein AGABI2DRAFT_116765 [Agaricus bisporus var. bisporus H97]
MLLRALVLPFLALAALAADPVEQLSQLASRGNGNIKLDTCGPRCPNPSSASSYITLSYATPQLGLVAAPVVFTWAPAEGDRKSANTLPDKYDFNEGFGAGPFADSVSRHTPVKIPYREPIGWTRLILTCIFGLSLLLALRFASPLFQSRWTWALGTISTSLIMTSGYMFIRLETCLMLVPTVGLLLVSRVNMVKKSTSSLSSTVYFPSPSSCSSLSCQTKNPQLANALKSISEPWLPFFEDVPFSSLECLGFALWSYALGAKLLDPDEKVRAAVCKMFSQLDYLAFHAHVFRLKGWNLQGPVRAEALNSLANYMKGYQRSYSHMFPLHPSFLFIHACARTKPLRAAKKPQKNGIKTLMKFQASSGQKLMNLSSSDIDVSMPLPALGFQCLFFDYSGLPL